MEKKVLKKLSLNKEEIVDLNKAEMGQLRGGEQGTITITISITTTILSGDTRPKDPTPTPTPEYIPSDTPGKDNCLSEVVVTPSPTPAVTM